MSDQSKIKLSRAGGYDPAKGPQHPDNQDPTLEPCPPSAFTGKPCLLQPGHAAHSPAMFHHYAAPSDARLTPIQYDMLRRFAFAVCFTSPTTPAKWKSGDKARAIDDLIGMGLLGPHGAAPNRPTADGFEVLLERVKEDVAFAALKKANGRIARCKKPQSLDAAHGESRAADERYRAIAAERDLIVKARNKVVGR